MEKPCLDFIENTSDVYFEAKEQLVQSFSVFENIFQEKKKSFQTFLYETDEWFLSFDKIQEILVFRYGNNVIKFVFHNGKIQKLFYNTEYVFEKNTREEYEITRFRSYIIDTDSILKEGMLMYSPEESKRYFEESLRYKKITHLQKTLWYKIFHVFPSFLLGIKDSQIHFPRPLQKEIVYFSEMVEIIDAVIEYTEILSEYIKKI
jgi:hypothetical protein